MSQGMRAKLQKIKALRGTKLMLVIAISAIIGLWLLSSIINGIFWRRRNGRLSRRLPPKWSSPSKCRRKSNPGRSFPTPNRL